MPGSAADEPDTVDDGTVTVGVDRAEEDDLCPAASRTPAMPPAARPCGRTAAAGNRSSWASEVMSTRSSSPVAQLDGADDLVARPQADDLPASPCSAG